MKKTKRIGPFEAYEEWLLLTKRAGGHLPYLTIRNTKSCACRFRKPSLKTEVPGRVLHLLSSGESHVADILEYSGNVRFINEQVPLDPKETYPIAAALGLKHPSFGGAGVLMTTDFVVRLHKPVGGSLYKAIQVKHTQEDVDKPRTNEILRIEAQYWKQRGVNYSVVISSALDRVYLDNLKMILPYRFKKGLHPDFPGQALKLFAAALSEYGDLQWAGFHELAERFGLELDFKEVILRLLALGLISFPLESKPLYCSTLREFAMT